MPGVKWGPSSDLFRIVRRQHLMTKTLVYQNVVDTEGKQWENKERRGRIHRTRHSSLICFSLPLLSCVSPTTLVTISKSISHAVLPACRVPRICLTCFIIRQPSAMPPTTPTTDGPKGPKGGGEIPKSIDKTFRKPLTNQFA